MFRRITLAVSFAAGYVLGAKAGEERYEELQDAARAVLSRPAVQDLVASASSIVGGGSAAPAPPPVPPTTRPVPPTPPAPPVALVDEVVVPPVPAPVPAPAADLADLDAGTSLPTEDAVLTPVPAPVADLPPVVLEPTDAAAPADVTGDVAPEERSIDDLSDLELELLTAPTPPPADPPADPTRP